MKTLFPDKRDRHVSRVHAGRLAFQSFLLALNMNVMLRAPQITRQQVFGQKANG